MGSVKLVAQTCCHMNARTHRFGTWPWSPHKVLVPEGGGCQDSPHPSSLVAGLIYKFPGAWSVLVLTPSYFLFFFILFGVIILAVYAFVPNLFVSRWALPYPKLWCHILLWRTLHYLFSNPSCIPCHGVLSLVCVQASWNSSGMWPRYTCFMCCKLS